MANILLAEDDEIMRITVQDRLRKNRWHVDAVQNGKEAAEQFKKQNYHLVISDIRMPGMDGRELLDLVRGTSQDTDIIMMTAYGSVEDAIECLKKGAADYILKPFNMDDLIIRVTRILEVQSIKARCYSLEENCPERRKKIIGDSPAIKSVFGIIAKVAPTESTVLITGESGTGKELAANALHMNSGRADKPFVRINCAAIPEGLMESELFGHEKGSFTGAHTRKPGKFEMADGGTLLLDEIGELPLPLQAKLLRVLQENEYERVGGTSTVKVDVRIICATSKKLEVEVKAGRFREDLFYRLNVIPLVMPPLRERLEDVPQLVKHFLHEFGTGSGKGIDITTEAMEMLICYSYPGNIRELKNIIERASVLCRDGMITVSDLPADMGRQGNGNPEDRTDSYFLCDAVAHTEKNLILRVLSRVQGKRAEAANLLGISRKNLWEKMKQYEISV